MAAAANPNNRRFLSDCALAATARFSTHVAQVSLTISTVTNTLLSASFDGQATIAYADNPSQTFEAFGEFNATGGFYVYCSNVQLSSILTLVTSLVPAGSILMRSTLLL